MTALFVSKVAAYGPRLMKEFGLTAEECAAVFGNLGHESAGFAALQEQGKRHGTGGWGWAQWTGARRSSFNSFAAKHGLSLSSDEANYEFLVFELRWSEAGAITAMRRAVGLSNKVNAFMRVFERPGIPALSRRVTWARLALATLTHGSAPSVSTKARVVAARTRLAVARAPQRVASRLRRRAA